MGNITTRKNLRPLMSAPAKWPCLGACASRCRLPSVLVVTRVRRFRSWGGREGTCPVSGVVSVGGFVSFDSSNGAQERMWAKLSTKDSAPKTNKKLETRQRSTEDDTHNATQEEAEQRSTEKPATKYSSPCTSKERKKNEKRSEEKSRKEKHNRSSFSQHVLQKSTA